jgi:hypothetical protein
VLQVELVLQLVSAHQRDCLQPAPGVGVGGSQALSEL